MNLEEAINVLELSVKQVVRAALTDDKTLLGNALALEKAASSVGAGGINPDVVVFGDLNRFKSLNDQFGHIVGDAAIGQAGVLIKALAEECQAQAFRPSGDEFIILLPRTSLEQFKAKTASFASCSFLFNEKNYETALSFGYAVSQGEDNFADLQAKAEMACQIAKSQGDGTCIEWSEELDRKAVNSLRERCAKCEAIVTCYVPRLSALRGAQLLCCPYCAESFTTD